MDEQLRRAAEMIEAARRTRGISERKAASAAGVSPTWWRQVMAGARPDPGTLVKMARAVGIEQTVRGQLGRPTPVPDPNDRTEVAIMTSEELTEQERFDAIEELRERRAQNKAGGNNKAGGAQAT